MAIKTLFTALNKFDLLSLTNIPLTGVVADNPIDGVLMVSGMYVMLTDQTTTAQIGGYSVASNGVNYTLTFQLDLSSSASFANPFLFEVLRGDANQGSWSYNNFNSTPTFRNLYLKRDTIGGVPIIRLDGFINPLWINPRIKQKSITPAQSPYLLSLDEYSSSADCNTGNVVIILPTRAVVNTGVLFQIILSRFVGANKLTIQTQGADQIEIGNELFSSYDVTASGNTQFVTGNDVTNLSLPAYTIDS